MAKKYKSYKRTKRTKSFRKKSRKVRRLNKKLKGGNPPYEQIRNFINELFRDQAFLTEITQISKNKSVEGFIKAILDIINNKYKDNHLIEEEYTHFSSGAKGILKQKIKNMEVYIKESKSEEFRPEEFNPDELNIKFNGSGELKFQFIFKTNILQVLIYENEDSEENFIHYPFELTK